MDWTSFFNVLINTKALATQLRGEWVGFPPAPKCWQDFLLKLSENKAAGERGAQCASDGGYELQADGSCIHHTK